jgi:hypothetical protein
MIFLRLARSKRPTISSLILVFTDRPQFSTITKAYIFSSKGFHRSIDIRSSSSCFCCGAESCQNRSMSSSSNGIETAGGPPNTLLFFNRLKERVDGTPTNRPVPGKVVSRSALPHDPFAPPPQAPLSSTTPTMLAPSVSQSLASASVPTPRKASSPSDVVTSPGPKSASARPTDRRNAPYRITQFESILNADVVDLSALRKLCWNGIPHQYRPLAWPLLLGYHPSRKERREDTVRRKRHEYQDFIPLHYDLNHPSNFPDSEAEQTSFEGKTWRQIAVDLPRTCPDQPFFHQQPVRKALERILYIWSVRHPASGYVQGMNDLLTPIILTCCQAFVDEPTRCDTVSLGASTMVTFPPAFSNSVHIC